MIDLMKTSPSDATVAAASQTEPSPSDALDRASVPGLDAILGHPFRVLDDGFVRVVDYMGNDASVVQAARVSYGVGTKRVREDRGLIRYLLRHAHTTPFEMCEIKFHVRVPMDVWRQWIRHRTANVNEYSTRYSIAIDAAQQTGADDWRLQSSINRQGSANSSCSRDVGEKLSAEERALHRRAREVYDARLETGVAREQARKDLPLSTYTEAYWKIDLHNLLHFLRLRMSSHAQQEIRAYALIIGDDIVSQWVPTVWEAFGDYTQHCLQFSRLESEIVRALVSGARPGALRLAEEHNFIRVDGGGELTPSREGREFEVKLSKIGLTLVGG